MRILPTAMLLFLASVVTCVQGRAQAAPAWADPANWTKIRPNGVFISMFLCVH
jgi:hypothetical protein